MEPRETTLTVGIAGWTACLRFESAGLARRWRRTGERFLGESTSPVAIDVRRFTEAPLVTGPRSYPEALPERDGTLRLRDSDYEATIAADGQSAVVLTEGTFAIDTVLKLMLARHLAERGGLLVHGVAVAHEGRAALFSGVSGAGKSTLGALWRGGGGQLLSDELVAVWPAEAGFLAAGTPWNTGEPVQAVLQAVGTLGWAETSSLRPTTPSQVARVLLLNTLLTEATAGGRSGLLSRTSALLSRVHSAHLVFARDGSASDAIRSALGG